MLDKRVETQFFVHMNRSGAIDGMLSALSPMSIDNQLLGGPSVELGVQTEYIWNDEQVKIIAEFKQSVEDCYNFIINIEKTGPVEIPRPKLPTDDMVDTLLNINKNTTSSDKKTVRC